ncbi:hypothetical protein A5886_000830 [Enterococcus sp. 8G7_MSG3316]|uniref:Transglutaminase-like domain-containing protein n=1 Tax=Candidatus Enterococcus testudinis TaxID=1834191 RepID=A0A242A405_9ENTE|nr:transglutaminase domain-containing protein [Enterococcus sp. 8G7_MSG3316]OTN75754.1 hypothetical protein A5886_000830 [Enterococcus sp. 8G7_MSG3316]
MKDDLIKKWLLGILTFVSLTLMILPFVAVYDLGNESTLLLYTAFVCLVLVLLPKVRYSLPLLLIAWFVVLYRIFPYGTRFSFEWLARFGDDFMRAVREIIVGDVGYITELAAVTLIVTWVLFLAILPIVFRWFFFTYAMMLTYLLTVVIFNRFDLTWHIVGILICGIVSALIEQVEEWQKRKAGEWALVFLVFAAFTFVAVYLPRTAVRDQLVSQSTMIRTNLNQLGFYRFIEEHGTPSGSRTGFSENDRQLGGPLLDDTTILFEAQQKTRHYWRVESKDFYSGKGWINTIREEDFRTDPISLTVADEQYRQPYTETEEISIDFMNHGDYVPLPYGRSQLNLATGAQGLQVDDSIRRVDLLAPESLTQVSITWDQPDYAAENLQTITLQQPDTTVNYIQLPDTLPDRIPALAEEITAESTTLFDQVTAIESYLKNTINFRYSKTDAVYPEEEQDYVDQFLFESQVGYCDNFSSAMVVLLRTLDIPARWAKGFAPGDAVSAEGTTTYTVRNQNAHSWVEVFFEGYGWIPFEPTPSFQNPDRPVLQTDTTTDETTPSESTAQTSESSVSSSTAETSSSSSTAATEATDDPWLSAEWIRLLCNGLMWLAALLVAGLFYMYRHKLFRIRIWLICRLSKAPLTQAYPLLLKQTTRILYRHDAETLPDYAQRLEKMYPLFHGSFIQLTAAYEAYLYGGSQDQGYQQLILHTAEQIGQLKQVK